MKEEFYKNFIFPENYIDYNYGEHPALRIPFNVLYEELKKRENNNLVSCSRDGNLELFKYTRKTVCEKKWDYFTLLARGIILSLSEKKVISLCLLKFFNYGEIGIDITKIDKSEFTVLEKMDGSTINMFFTEGKWRFTTNGSFISEQAKWADTWAHKYLSLDIIDKNNTYIFEAIYRENKIVVDYDFEGLVLLSIFDSYGLEYNYKSIKLEASYMNIRYAIQYDFNDINSILDKASTLDKNSEGYVIRFKNGLRLKIKGDEYIRIHKIISKITPIALWESMLNGDNLDKIKTELPEEMEKDLDAIVNIFNNLLKEFIKEVEYLHNRTKSMTDKKLGLYMQMHPEYFSNVKFKETIKFIFPMRKNKFYETLNCYKSTGRRKIFKSFRPKSNILDGYTPSSIMNRFSNANN